MSSAPKIPDLPDPDARNQVNLQRFLESLREIVQTREGRRGDPMDKVVTFRDLLGIGLATRQPGGGWVGTGGGAVGPQGPQGPAGPAGGTYVPDYTAPPSPTGLAAVSMFRGALIEWDAPTYTVGHGNAYTEVFVAQYGGSGPLPTFVDAISVGKAAGSTSAFVHDAAMGAQLHIWAKHVTEDGIASATPAGGANGVQITIGRVGNSDLGPLIIEAAQLASGAVTAPKLAAGSIAVGSAAVADGAIINAMIATAAVDSAKIADASIITAKIADAAINDAKIANLNASKITAGTLSADRIGANSITAAKIDSRELTIKDAAGAVIFGASQNLDINRLQAGVDFQPDAAWDFTGTTGGWTANSANLTPGAQELYIGSTGADPQFVSPVFSISGDRSPLIRMRVLKSAGSWEGIVFFQTSGHGFDAGFYKTIPAPPDNVWTTIEIDMSTLSVGGSDWTSSTIQRLRFDFFNVSGATVAVKWILIGRQGPLRISQSNASTFIADAAINTAQIGELNASKITAGSITTDRLQIGSVSQFAAVSWAASAMTVLSNTSAILPALDAGSFTRAIAGRAIRINVEASVEIDIRASGFTAGHYMPEIQFWVGTSSLSRLHKVRLPSGYVQPGMPRIYWPVNFTTMSSDNTMFPLGVAKQIRISVDFFQFLDPATALGVPCIASAAVNANVVADENKV